LALFSKPYLVVGKWRIPWNFRVGRGKGTPSPAQLGLKLVRSLPQSLTSRFRVMILADTAFGSVEFLHGIRKLKYHAITGLAITRKLVDGRVLRHLHQQGQQVRLVGLNFPVTVSWYYLKRDNGRLEKRATLLGMYRWLILSLTAFLIAHWAYLFTQDYPIPDWGEAANTALEYFFPQIAVSLLLLHIQRLIPLARSCGFDIQIFRCKM
jgi:hypothetical protein